MGEMLFTVSEMMKNLTFIKAIMALTIIAATLIIVVVFRYSKVTDNASASATTKKLKDIIVSYAAIYNGDSFCSKCSLLSSYIVRQELDKSE